MEGGAGRTTAPYIDLVTNVVFAFDHFWRCIARVAESSLEQATAICRVGESEIDNFNEPPF